jgi:hypothetical protein
LFSPFCHSSPSVESMSVRRTQLDISSRARSAMQPWHVLLRQVPEGIFLLLPYQLQSIRWEINFYCSGNPALSSRKVHRSVSSIAFSNHRKIPFTTNSHKHTLKLSVSSPPSSASHSNLLEFSSINLNLIKQLIIRIEITLPPSST